MPIYPEAYAKKTRDDRFRMKALVDQRKLSEREALAELYPADPTNRGKKLSRWKVKGLWPIPVAEIEDHLTQYNTLVPQAGILEYEDTIIIDPSDQMALLERAKPKKAVAASTAQDQPSVSQHEPPATHFDDATVQALMEVVAWWRDHKGEVQMPIPMAAQAPSFRRKGTTTRSVRIAADMLEAAVKKAREEKGRTGGTFNSLVEVLLWEFLGRPEEFVDR